MTQVMIEVPPEGVLISPAPSLSVVKTEDLIEGEAEYAVVKSAPRRQFTLGLAYPAMRADKGVAADGHIDFVSPEALEKTAWNWLRKYRDVNLFHEGGTEGHFTPTESYIWRAPDWTPEGSTYTVRKGDWLMGGTWDNYGWSLVEAGLVNGWSPEGGARRVLATAERVAQLRS